MAVGFPTKTTYANGDVFSASDINDTNGTINLLTSSTLSMAAGKNPVINGGMDIWQRGTSIAGTSTAFGPDRFQAYRAVAGSTFSRQVTGDTTNLPNIQYSVRVQRNSGNTATDIIYLLQGLESANSIPFAGKTVTLSFYARKGANFSSASSLMTAQLVSGTGTDQNIAAGFTGASTRISQTPTLTTTWQRFSYTGTILGTATQLGLYFNYTPVGTAGADDWFEITGIQLENGSTATTFSRAGGTIQGELAACKRYYQRLTATTGTSYSKYAVGWGTSSTNAYVLIPAQSEFRIAPTAIDFSTLILDDQTAGGFAVTAVTFANSGATLNAVAINCTAASGLTAYRPFTLMANNSSTAFIGFSAEL
jgi:hypothetical protein